MPQKCFEEKYVDLLLIGEEDKTYYVLIKHLSTNMYGHSLLCGRKNFCCYCLQGFSTKMYQNVMVNIALKLMMKKQLKQLEKLNMIDSNILIGK